jgi:hypothetical protein
LITHTLKEFDIDVDRHEADRSLIIRDANEIILRPTLDSFCNTQNSRTACYKGWQKWNKCDS